MSVKIGDVTTFAKVKPGKAQVLKILEESAEVFSAWENMLKLEWREAYGAVTDSEARSVRDALLDECADVIQATCNLIAALEVDDFTPYTKACDLRNKKRGRI